MAAYARLARLPPPTLAPVEVASLVRRVARLERRLRVAGRAGPASSTLQADADQLEQLLINLVRNAVDAALETGGGVSVGWRRRGANARDLGARRGPRRLPTRRTCSSPSSPPSPRARASAWCSRRQIAEAHGGTLVLRNRADRAGCEALLRLPLRQTERASSS